MTNSPHHN